MQLLRFRCLSPERLALCLCVVLLPWDSTAVWRVGHTIVVDAQQQTSNGQSQPNVAYGQQDESPPYSAYGLIPSNVDTTSAAATASATSSTPGVTSSTSSSIAQNTIATAAAADTGSPAVSANDIGSERATTTVSTTQGASSTTAFSNNFGLPRNTSLFIAPVNTDVLQTPYEYPAAPEGQPQAERRTFDIGDDGGGALTSILTPIAGAAAAALTAGGGASLLSLPNANIQPTLQKTFVVNLGPHNPPLVVQGNAFQPGASAGATVNHPAPQYGSGGSSSRHGGSGHPKRGSYGGGGGRIYGPPHPQRPPPIYKPQQRAGPAPYPNSPSLPQIAGKLGIANLLNLAKQSGFLENLLIGGPFTFFAPSDEAFAKLPKIFLTQAQERPELLKTLLLYHLVPDTITTRHFTNDLLLPTLNTKKLRINLYQLGYKKIATVNGAIITRADQYIINGVIHVIDRVLFPVANGTILAVINAPNCQPFDVISTVLAIAGLYDKLQEDGPFTIFLPNTEAFGLIPEAERDRLIANTSLIREAFLYHIVPGTYYSQGLQDNQWLETLSSFGVPLQVGMVSDGYSRRFDSVNGAVRIVRADIPAENGVIHIVDKIITPFQTYLPCLQPQ